MLPTIGVAITLASLAIASPFRDIHLHINIGPQPRPAEGELCWLKCLLEEPQCPADFVIFYTIVPRYHQST